MSAVEETLIRWDQPIAELRTITYRIGDWEHTAPIEVVERDFLHVRNALPMLGQLVELAEEIDRWKVPTVITGDSPRVDLDYRSSPILRISGIEDERLTQFEGVLELLAPLFAQAYSTFVNSHAACGKLSGFDLLRYKKGEFFREHVDVVWDNAALVHRRLTLLAFWSTEDCSGGELWYPRQCAKFSPVPGDVVVVPAGDSFPHEAMPVVEGAKYSLVTWFA